MDKPEVVHFTSIFRQLRRYVRDVETKVLQTTMPLRRCAQLLNEAAANDPESLAQGNSKVGSKDVYQKARSEGLRQQDYASNDIDDVAAMQTTDENTNFISNIFTKGKFAVYIHSKSQHLVLHKLHKKRAIYGVPIVGRIDATGNVARDVTEAKLLLHALTVNVAILRDRKSSAVPLTEQYNCDQSTKAVCQWLFDFVSSHHAFYDEVPLLLDYIISDFFTETFMRYNWHSIHFHNIYKYATIGLCIKLKLENFQKISTKSSKYVCAYFAHFR